MRNPSDYNLVVVVKSGSGKVNSATEAELPITSDRT